MSSILYNALSEVQGASWQTAQDHSGDADDAASVPLWLEVLCVLTFTVGFLLWRLRQDSRPKDKKSNAPEGKTCKKIEAKFQAGESQAAIQEWRAHQCDTPSTPDVLKMVVQGLLEVSPDTAVEEVVDHMMNHRSSATPMVAVSVIDAAARHGKADVLSMFVEAMESRLNVTLTTQMHEIILGGYAFGDDQRRLAQHADRMASIGEKFTARAHSLVLRGLLRNARADAALKQMKQMIDAGFTLPYFAPVELIKVFCEAGRYAEVMQAILPHVSMSSDAACVLLDQCLKEEDLAIALRVKSLLDKAQEPLGLRGFDSVLKLLATAGDPQALQVFQEMQKAGYHASEGLCVGLLARSADSKFLRFAELIVAYVRQHSKMTIALYSALMKVYAYSGMYEKACDLYDQILKEGMEPDQMMYNCLMKFAASCGRVELSQRLAKKIPTLDIQNCMSLIRAASRTKDVGMACRILEQLKAAGQAVDTAAYNCALDVCAVAGDSHTAQKLLNEMRMVKAYPDLISYNTMLKCLAVKKDVREARRTLLEMERAGYPPNDISYNVIINIAVSAGSLRDAWETVDMMAKKGIKVDQYTISTLLKAVKKSNSKRDVMQVFELLDQSGIDIVSDEVLLNTVLETCVRYNDKRRTEAVLSSYASSKLRPAMHTYGMLIRACASVHQIRRCRELWDDMVHRRGLEPNELVLGCMLNALVSNGCGEDALQLLRQWKSAVKPNAVMYSTLLKGFTSSNGAGKAMELLEEMRADRVEMNVSLYNSLIDVHARIGAMDTVLRLRDMMKQDGCQPDDLTTSLIVKAYCAAGNLKMAFQIFENMCSTRVGHGDTVIFNTLLDGCIRQNDFESADHLLAKIDAYKIIPSNFTLGIVVKMWGRRRHLDRAFEAVEKMTKKHDFQVNGPVQTCLMGACLLNDDLPRALQVFDQLTAGGISADSRAYGNLISGAARLGDVEVAVRLTEEAFGLTEKKIHFRAQEMDSNVISQVVRCLEQAGQMDSIGMHLLRRLRERGVPVGTHIAAMMHTSSGGKPSRGSGGGGARSGGGGWRK